MARTTRSGVWIAPVCVSLCLVGCPRRFPQDDAGVDAYVPPPDAGPPPDAHVEPGQMSVPSPPAVVEREGSAGLLLRGIVLTPSGAVDGEVLIVGDRIACAAVSCADNAGAANATVVNTLGVISPGLIDAHNHLTYDFLPEWVAGDLYDNRYTWADEAAYEEHIRPFSDGRNENARICPGAKWGELRSIAHATTTVMGQCANRACLNRLARNADHYHGLGYDHMRTTISSPREITDADADNLVQGFIDPSTPTTRYAVHMQEGISGSNVTEEFDSFAGRDPRSNRHSGTSLLAANGQYAGVALMIHSMGLTSVQLDEARDTEAHVVWSPSSNLVLYGETAPIREMLDLGINVGMGPDWTVSGEDHMLGEMRFAFAYGEAEGIGTLTPERIWRIATEGSAIAVGLEAHIGRLEMGMVADVAVFGRRAADPYRAVLESAAADVRLVLIGGQVYFGDLALEASTALNGDCDTIDACGADKFICVRNTPGADAGATESLGDVQAQLETILADYGRVDDLEPLIRCD